MNTSKSCVSSVGPYGPVHARGKQSPGVQPVDKLSLVALLNALNLAIVEGYESSLELRAKILPKMQSHVGPGIGVDAAFEAICDLVALMKHVPPLPLNVLRLEGFRTSVKVGMQHLNMHGGCGFDEVSVIPSAVWFVNPCRASISVGGNIHHHATSVVVCAKRYMLSESEKVVGAVGKLTGYWSSHVAEGGGCPQEPSVLCYPTHVLFTGLARWLAVANTTSPVVHPNLRWHFERMLDEKRDDSKCIQFESGSFAADLQSLIVWCSKKTAQWKRMFVNLAKISVGFSDMLNLFFEGKQYYHEIDSVCHALNHIDKCAVEDFLEVEIVSSVRGMQFGSSNVVATLSTFPWDFNRRSGMCITAVSKYDVQDVLNLLGSGIYYDPTGIYDYGLYSYHPGTRDLDWCPGDFENASVVFATPYQILLNKVRNGNKILIGISNQSRYLPFISSYYACVSVVLKVTWNDMWVATRNRIGSILLCDGMPLVVANFYAKSLGFHESYVTKQMLTSHVVPEFVDEYNPLLAMHDENNVLQVLDCTAGNVEIDGGFIFRMFGINRYTRVHELRSDEKFGYSSAVEIQNEYITGYYQVACISDDANFKESDRPIAYEGDCEIFPGCTFDAYIGVTDFYVAPKIGIHTNYVAGVALGDDSMTKRELGDSSDICCPNEVKELYKLHEEVLGRLCGLGHVAHLLSSCGHEKYQEYLRTSFPVLSYEEWKLRRMSGLEKIQNDDVVAVVRETGSSRGDAINALVECGGGLMEAIMQIEAVRAEVAKNYEEVD